MNAETRTAPAAWTLACERVTVQRGGRDLLADVSLVISAGERICIVGPNGAGKTTLIRALLGLTKPTRGGVTRDGRPLNASSARERGRFAAYVPQSPSHVPPLGVRDVVLGGRYPQRGAWQAYAAADHAAVDAALRQCGLTHLAGRPLPTLSGGERQKVYLAAALAQEPCLLVLDEPTTALDPAVQLDLVTTLRAWATSERAVVMVSHDLQLPLSIAQRVIALRSGRIVADGPVGDVLSPATLGDLYGAPFDVATTANGATVVLPAWWGTE